LAGFDHEAIARAKSHVDPITLPDNTEYAPALKDFFDLSALPRQEAPLTRLDQLGLNTDSDLERNMGQRVAEVARETGAWD